MAKEFIVVASKNKKISEIVATAFQDYSGQVTLGELEERLKNGIGYNPLTRLNEGNDTDNRQLNIYRGLRYQVYELIGGTTLYR